MSDSVRSRAAGEVLVSWCVLGAPAPEEGSLRAVGPTSARIRSTAVAPPGAELRVELLHDSGASLAVGLAIVARAEPTEGMFVEWLALGLDPALVGSLRPLKKKIPPPLPPAPIPALPAVPDIPFAPPPSLPAVQVVDPLDLGAISLLDEPAEPPVFDDPFASDGDEVDDEIAPEIEFLQIKRRGIIIGIDLGTTNTCAAYVVDGQPKIIPGRTGTNTIPSMITFDPDGRWFVGQRAADRQILYPMRTVYGSKRLVGRTYRAELASELQQHFAYPLGEAEGQRFGVRIDDRVISMDTIAARVLDEVRATAEEHFKGPIEAAVITVPAYFSEVQREAVRRAAREANLTVHRIVNEPTAAAIAYGHKIPGQRSRVAVWDFGGGTFDFSIVLVDDGLYEVLATGGDNFVGGSDFDDLLASELLSEFRRQVGDFDPDPQQIARLREAAEVAKKALSFEPEHTVRIPGFSKSPRADLLVILTRERFDELAASLIARTIEIASEVMRSAGISPTEIDDVLLVGGTTRIPAVQDSVARLFNRRPSKRVNPDEAVAIGAAFLADEIGTPGAPVLLDILPMSVGYGVPGLRFIPIVARNSRLPVQQDLELDADILGNVSVPLFQGESLDIRQDEYLCSIIVEDRSLWENGRVSLRLSFDEHCAMSIDAWNARTGRALPVRLDRTRALEDLLRELSRREDPPPPPEPPPKATSTLGKVLGRLFKVFGRLPAVCQTMSDRARRGRCGRAPGA